MKIEEYLLSNRRWTGYVRERGSRRDAMTRVRRGRRARKWTTAYLECLWNRHFGRRRPAHRRAMLYVGHVFRWTGRRGQHPAWRDRLRSAVFVR